MYTIITVLAWEKELEIRRQVKYMPKFDPDVILPEDPMPLRRWQEAFLSHFSRVRTNQPSPECCPSQVASD